MGDKAATHKYGRPKVDALERLKADPDGPERVYRMMTDRECPRTLRKIANELGLQRGAFVHWFMEVHNDLYMRALRVRANELTDEALAIADASNDPKLQVETRRWLASRYDRQLYGDDRNVTVGVSGDLTKLLRDISERKNREIRAAQVLEAEVVTREVVPALEAPE